MYFPAGKGALENCEDRADAPACLLRNWRTYLAAIGQQELSAPPGEAEYRAVIFPACNGPIAVRLDVGLGGQAALATVQAPDPPPRASVAELQVTLHWPLWRKAASASAADVAEVKHALSRNWFNDITADPSALWIRDEAYDGMTGVIEADVDGRYRYVARHSGELNSGQIRRMADAFMALAAKRTPGFRPIHPC